MACLTISEIYLIRAGNGQAPEIRETAKIAKFVALFFEITTQYISDGR
jgi:hypothetical protein